ncbi:MAG: pilus assembly protein TadG-related protein [Pseudolysinimonas sp.]|uniref:pilus assembly protein TadG-related protein n=1 Tax=Pseudolysinimonas sp. TaxID=2680009 RepID=UPI0032639674
MRVISRLRDDDGSTLPLVAGFGALGLALVLVAAAASSLYLERKQLFTLADGAALVGAEAFDLAEVDTVDGVPDLVLEPDDVHRDVVTFLATTPNGGFESLVLEEATTRDGASATVTLSAIWRPPIVTVFFPEGFRIETTATARTVFG